MAKVKKKMSTTPTYKCRVCKHQWSPRSPNMPEDWVPQACPKCKRYDWLIPGNYKSKDKRRVEARA